MGSYGTNSKRKATIVVFVHDAGGAEVIGAYIRAHPEKRFVSYGGGPARTIFKRLKVPILPAKTSQKDIGAQIARHRDADFLLSAEPGWMSKTELHAILEAEKIGMCTVCYMDSWDDKRRAFEYPKKEWKKNLPDMFWAGDAYAVRNAKRLFPHVPCTLVPNEYFKGKVARYKKLRTFGTDVLFMSQDGDNSPELLSMVLEFAKQKKMSIRIRLHPVDARNKYDAVLKNAAYKHVVVSPKQEIEHDLARARVVVGTETVGMALSVLCGLPTISFVGKKRPMLPFKEIYRVRNKATLARALSRTLRV